MSEWKDIETAPRDGTRFRVRRKGCCDYDRFPTTAVYSDIEDRFVCTAAFIDRNTMQMFHQPDEWLDER